jgi:hypothetical protein
LPTISDLQAVLRDRESHAGDPGEVLARVQFSIAASRPHPRRTRYLIAAACAAVLAVAAVPALVARSGHEGASTTATPPAVPGAPLSTPILPPSPGHGPQLRFGFTIKPMRGTDIEFGAISGLVQGATVRTDSSHVYGVYVFTRGSYDPTEARNGETVTVNGHHGYFGAVPQVPSYAALQLSVVWEYAPDCWAVVASSLLGQGRIAPTATRVKSTELAIADAVREGYTALRMPIQLGYLPPGLVAERAAAGGYIPPMTGLLSGSIVVGDGLREPSNDSEPVSIVVPPPSSTKLCSATYWRASTRHLGSVSPITLDRKHGCVLRSQAGAPAGVILRTGHFYIELHVSPRFYGQFTTDEIAQIASHVRVASNPQDPTTWFDAAQGVQH